MEFSKWDETSCSLLCQHPCCWSSINRIERSVPRKSTSTVKLDAINYDSSRDNKEKTEGKRRKEDNVFDGDMIITGPTICDLLKSFPVCPEPLFPLGANSGTRQNKYGLYTEIDSQESLRFDVPRCPPGSEEKVPILSYEENIVPCVHIVQAFIINGDLNSLSRPQYVWIPAKKKETKENAFSGGQKPSTQIFEASQVLECKNKQRKENMTDVCHNWSTWVSSSKFRYKTHKYHHKPVEEAERQRTISSDLDLKFCTGNLYQEAPEHLAGKKWVKENLLKTRGLSADSRIFWKPTSIKGSATNKRCPFNLEVSQNTSQDDFLSNGNYNLQKWSKIESKNNDKKPMFNLYMSLKTDTENYGHVRFASADLRLIIVKESVKIPAFEASQGKLSTINLELGSKDECPITQPMNYQKKEMDFSLVSVSPLTGNLPMEVKNNLNKLSSEKEQKESKDVPGTICGSKHENVLAAKEGKRQKKGRLENVAKCTFEAARRISFIQTLDAFEPKNSCCIEAMPLHRVRITNTPTTQQRKQVVCSKKKTNCHISSKRHSTAAMTSHKRVMSSPPNELKIITTEKNEPTEKVDFPDLPKPPPPSPQMLSNFNRGPSSHQLFDLNESECMFLLENPKTISNLESVNDKFMSSKGMNQL